MTRRINTVPAIGLVLLLAAMPAVAGKWELGKPAPVSEPGRLSVALGTAEVPNDVLADAAELRKRGIKVALTGEADGKAYLVDKDGVVRRDGNAPRHAGKLRQFVQQWEDGRILFVNKCARCHGEDGMDTGYPFILQLGGIGKKWTPAEIKDKLNPVGEQAHPVLVRGELFSREEFDGLVVYVAGL